MFHTSLVYVNMKDSQTLLAQGKHDSSLAHVPFLVWLTPLLEDPFYHRIIIKKYLSSLQIAHGGMDN